MIADIREPQEGAFFSEKIAEIVESLYDVGKVTEVYEIFGGYTNRSFGVKAVKAGHETMYCVRKYKSGITAGEIRFEHALIRHAIKKGFKIVADVVLNTAGETFVQPNDSHSMFAVFEYLDGEDRYSWDRPNLADTEFESAGRVLANFHNAVRDFYPEGLQRTEPPISALWPQMADKLAALSRQMRHGELQTYFAAHLENMSDMITGNPIDPSEAGGLPVIPIHCDYHPGNLKWTEDQVVGIFDFDWSKMDMRLFDVGLAVIYFCSFWDDDRDGELRFDKFAIFLGAYQHQLRQLAGLEPITPSEQKLLPKMLSIANIYVVHWEVSAYHDTAGADDDEYMTYLQHSVRLMHRLETHRAAVVGVVAEALS